MHGEGPESSPPEDVGVPHSSTTPCPSRTDTALLVWTLKWSKSEERKKSRKMTAAGSEKSERNRAEQKTLTWARKGNRPEDCVSETQPGKHRTAEHCVDIWTRTRDGNIRCTPSSDPVFKTATDMLLFFLSFLDFWCNFPCVATSLCSFSSTSVLKTMCEIKGQEVTVRHAVWCMCRMQTGVTNVSVTNESVCR